MNKKDAFLITIVCILAIVLTATLIIHELNSLPQFEPYSMNLKFTIHSRIVMYKSGVLVFDEYHAGHVTNLGLNITLGKLCGDTDFWVAEYAKNVTYISIGNQGSLSTSSVVLPGEWNRTQGTVSNEAYNHFNVTATFYPDAGPYTADCLGLNLDTSGSDLWGYDTFTEVTGIDDTFTINVYVEVTAA